MDERIRDACVETDEQSSDAQAGVVQRWLLRICYWVQHCLEDGRWRKRFFILATVERIKKSKEEQKKSRHCARWIEIKSVKEKKTENVYGTEGQGPHPDTRIPYTPLALSDVMVWDPRCFLYPTRSIPSMFFSPPIELGDDNSKSRETDRNDLYAVNRAWKESPTDRLKWKNAVVRTKQIYRVYTKCKK